MGTWGTDILADDLAADIEGEFLEGIGDGVSARRMTRRLIRYCRKNGILKNEQTMPVFWMALAATQAACGRLREDVKKKALKVIDAGGDLAWWTETTPEDQVARREAIRKLREQLLAPARPPTEVPKAYHHWSDWEVGHAVAYRLLSGRYVVMRVVSMDVFPPGKDRTPIVDLCDWVGDEIPSPDALALLPRRRTKYASLDNGYPNKFALDSNEPGDLPADRVRIVATGLGIAAETRWSSGMSFGGWKALDGYLKETFGIT